MLRVFVFIAVVIVALGAISAPLLADDWQWPSEMSLGGFRIAGIRGSINGDGSGSAVGTLQLRAGGDQRVSLTRSSRGDITGTVSMGARLAGGEVQGSFVLDAGGMKGVGTVRSSPRAITDASFNVDPGGAFNGSGKIDFGAVGMSVKFSLTGGSFGLSGSVPRQAQVDTPLALYSFSGELRVDGNSNRVGLTARGTVLRTGKVSNQRSSTQVSDVQVSPSDGTGKVSVDGVSVMFDFFK